MRGRKACGVTWAIGEMQDAPRTASQGRERGKQLAHAGATVVKQREGVSSAYRVVLVQERNNLRGRNWCSRTGGLW